MSLFMGAGRSRADRRPFSLHLSFQESVMWIRLGTFLVKPDALGELRTVYYRDCVPIVKAATGNVDCYLMENSDEGGRCAVCTIWETERDAKQYEASGSAMQVVEMVRKFFASPPLLESFLVSRP